MGLASPPQRPRSQLAGTLPGTVPPRDDALAAVRAGAWFSQLPPALRQALIDDGSLRRLVAGETLFARGDRFDGLYCVASGTMQIHASGESGKAALLGLLEPGTWFGEICLFDGQPRTHDAFAMGPCTLLHIPQLALLALLDEQPVYWRQLALLMSQKLRLTFINLEQLSLMPASTRVAHRLLMIADGYGQLDQPRRVLQLPQEQLASMLSLSRQTTNQILKDLQGQGIIGLAYGEIEILDAVRLRALATF